MTISFAPFHDPIGVIYRHTSFGIEHLDKRTDHRHYGACYDYSIPDLIPLLFFVFLRKMVFPG